MLFGVVSGVGRGMGVLDGVHVPQGEEGVLGGCLFQWFEWHIFNRNVFDSCVKS